MRAHYYIRERYQELVTYGLEEASVGFDTDFLISPVLAQSLSTVVFFLKECCGEIRMVRTCSFAAIRFILAFTALFMGLVCPSHL